MSDEKMAWIVRCQTCGQICACCVNDPTYIKDTAKFVASYIRKDLEVSKLAVESVRTAAWCHCGKPKPKRQRRKGKTDA